MLAKVECLSCSEVVAVTLKPFEKVKCPSCGEDLQCHGCGVDEPAETEWEISESNPESLYCGFECLGRANAG